MGLPKGRTNNPRGRPKDGTSWAAVLEKIGGEKIKSGDITKKEAVARVLWSEAAKGQAWAINALMDRLDGKPRMISEIDHTTNGESLNKIERVIVNTSD